VGEVLAWLRRRGTRRNVAGMARFGITAAKAYGVSMTTMRPLVRRLGRDQDLAEALWDTGWLEARLVAGFIADPARLTPRVMDRWAGTFDNWAVTDSTCLHAFRRSAYAWSRVQAWSRSRHEFVKRAAFALLASLAVHDTASPDSRFAAQWPRLVRAAGDERPYVRKAVNWALRQCGKRSLSLHQGAVRCATVIAARGTPAARWIAADALRELLSPAVIARLRSRAARPR